MPYSPTSSRQTPPSGSKGAARWRDGFSLIELLAVVAIILILLSLLLPMVGKLRERSYRAVCFSNMKNLQAGYNIAVTDRNGSLPSSDTGSGYGLTNPDDWWVSSQDIRIGAVWPYLKNEKVYTCPSYPIPARDYLKRHYSLSVRIGSVAGGSADALRTLSQVYRPSRTHVFMEEYDNRSVAIGPSPGALDGYVVARGGQWIDCPPTWHDMGAQFSYMDGHAEYHHWIGPKMRTVNCYNWFYGQYGQYWPTTPLDTDDWNWIIAGVNNAYP